MAGFFCILTISMTNMQSYSYLTILLVALCTIIGCDDDEEFDCTSSRLITSVTNIVSASCGLDNGSFELSVTGGQSPFEFSLTGANFQLLPSSNSRVETVSAGNFQLTVRDANGCLVNNTVDIPDVDSLTVSSTITTAGCGGAEGNIELDVTGGKEPYLFSLNGGTVQTNSFFSGLAAGQYTALITDQGGCQTNLTFNIISGTSYKDEIIPIIELNCAIADCHDGSNVALPDWTQFTNVQSLAETIKRRTSNETMPPPGSPDLMPSQIEAIACWVDDGALNN